MIFSLFFAWKNFSIFNFFLPTFPLLFSGCKTNCVNLPNKWNNISWNWKKSEINSWLVQFGFIFLSDRSTTVQKDISFPTEKISNDKQNCHQINWEQSGEFEMDIWLQFLFGCLFVYFSSWDLQQRGFVHKLLPRPAFWFRIF